MKVRFLGGGPLAGVLGRAAIRRGFGSAAAGAELIVVAAEIDDHRNLESLDRLMEFTLRNIGGDTPVVVTSQIPPGWTRPWSVKWPRIFYQPHTLIRGHEEQMAFAPESIVVGSADLSVPLPGAYVKYLSAFECPIHRMSYESAELSKLAVNYLLAAHIQAANELAYIASQIGADWEEILPSLWSDKRIGEHAYIRPGVIGGHLPRDVDTINRLRWLQ